MSDVLRAEGCMVRWQEQTAGGRRQKEETKTKKQWTTSTAPALCSCRLLLGSARRRHIGIADIKVSGDFLHVVVIFQSFHQLEHLFRIAALEFLVFLGD